MGTTNFDIVQANQFIGSVSGVTVTSDDITDATTIGKDILTAADAAAVATAIDQPVASAVAGADLAETGAVGVSDAFARADHVHPIPGVSVGAVRGTVLIQAAQADSVAADTAAMVTDFNALLAKLRTAGVIAP